MDPKEIKDLLRTLRELGASSQEIRALQTVFDGLTANTEEFDQQVKLVLSRISQLRVQADNAKTPFQNLVSIVRENALELQKSNALLNQGSSLQNKIVSITRDLSYDLQGITDLNKRDLSSKLEKLETLQEEAKIQSELARKELEKLGFTEEQLANQKEFDKAVAKLSTKKAQGDAKSLQAMMKYNAEQDAGLNGVIQAYKDRLSLEGDVSRAVGVTGALVEGTGALMERLGMRSGIFHDAMKASAQEMRELGKQAANNAKRLGTKVSFMERLNIAAAGTNILLKGFASALGDPAAIIGAVVTGFLDVQKSAAKAAQLTGQFDMSMGAANSTLATTTDVLETAVELTEKLGMNAQNVISDATLAKAAELKNTMGLAADEAAGLAVMAQTSGQNLDAVTEAVVSTTSEFNKANRSAISQGVILRDVAKTSDSIKASLGNNPKAIAAAATAARRMGMELSRVDDIASSLLDFESSIEAELEAQLLTGKNINMAKARELALNNDLAGLSKELFKNSASLAEFGNMNRIQQEAQAKALGMSRDELARIAYQRSLELGMTEEQAAAAAGVNAEDMKRMDIQEKIQKLIGKIQQAFAPILEVVVDIVDALAPAVQIIGGIIGGVVKFLNKLGVLKPAILGIAAILAAKSFMNSFDSLAKGAGKLSTTLGGLNVNGLKEGLNNIREKGLGGMIKKAKEFGNSIKNSFLAGKNGTKELSNQAGVYFDKNVQKFRDQTGQFVSADKAKAAGIDKRFTKNPKDAILKPQEGITDKINDDVKSKAPDTKSITDATKTPEPAKGLGEKIKEFLTGLTDGLKYAGQNAAQVALGGLALIPAALGLVAMTPAIPALALLQLINGPKFAAAMQGIGEGIAGLGKLLMGPQGLFLLAGAGMIALLGASLIPLGIAVSYFSADSGVGLLSAGLGLVGLAAGIVGMAASLPFIIPAALALAAMGAVLKRVAPAFEQAVPGFIALTDIGDGLVKVGKGMLALGLGIAGLGAGAALLAAFGPLAAVGLAAFAAGILTTGLLVIPALPGLIGLAGVLYLLAPSLAAIGAVGGGLAAASAGLLLLGPALIGLGASALLALPAILAAGTVGKVLDILYPSIVKYIGISDEFLKIGKGMAALGMGVAALGAGAALIAGFGALFAVGLQAMGVGIAAFGVQLMNPLFYAGLAALSVMAAGIALAGTILAQALPSFMGLGEAAPGMLKFAGALAVLGPAMALFGLTALVGLPALYLGLPALAALSLMGPGLEKAGNGLAAMAESLNKIAYAARNIDIAKLKEIKDTISDEAFNAAAGTVSAVSDMVANVSNQSNDTAILAEKLDLLIGAVNNGHTLEIFLDSNKIEKYRTLDKTKSS